MKYDLKDNLKFSISLLLTSISCIACKIVLGINAFNSSFLMQLVFLMFFFGVTLLDAGVLYLSIGNKNRVSMLLDIVLILIAYGIDFFVHDGLIFFLVAVVCALMELMIVLRANIKLKEMTCFIKNFFIPQNIDAKILYAINKKVLDFTEKDYKEFSQKASRIVLRKIDNFNLIIDCFLFSINDDSIKRFICVNYNDDGKINILRTDHIDAEQEDVSNVFISKNINIFIKDAPTMRAFFRKFNIGDSSTYTLSENVRRAINNNHKYIEYCNYNKELDEESYFDFFTNSKLSQQEKLAIKKLYNYLDIDISQAKNDFYTGELILDTDESDTYRAIYNSTDGYVGINIETLKIEEMNFMNRF